MNDLLNLTGLTAFHFLRPWWLILLIPIVIAFLYARRFAEQQPKWGKIIADHLLQALTIPGGNNGWVNPLNMGLFLLCLCALLLAGPTWQRQPSPFVQDEAALVVALNLSNTMMQTDIQPSRLERAKQKIMDLLEMRGSARTGLIAYSGSAHQIIPLSNDPDILKQFLAAVDGDMMPREGNFPETVIPLAKQMLRDASVPGTLLIIGDGVGPASIEKFKQNFSDTSFQLLVLGVGLTELAEGAAETAPIEDQFGGAHLALQEEALEQLAASANGYYQKSTADKRDVRRLNRLVDYHIAAVDDSDRPWKDAGYYLLYPIALIFLFWFRRGWTLNWCVAFLFVQALAVSPPTLAKGFAEGIVKQSEAQHADAAPPANLMPSTFSRIKREFMDLWLSRDQQGRYYFERGEYGRAASLFQDPAWKGIAFYYAENFSAAAEIFRQIDKPLWRFNLANALAQGQHYVLAVKTYSQVLEEDSMHAGALKNRNFVQKIINEINRMSASQQTEPGEATRELGDAPQRGDGADQVDIASAEAEQLTAEQLFADEAIHEMWMRQVQADPARFLGAKFQLQYRRQREQSQPQGNAE